LDVRAGITKDAATRKELADLLKKIAKLEDGLEQSRRKAELRMAVLSTWLVAAGFAALAFLLMFWGLPEKWNPIYKIVGSAAVAVAVGGAAGVVYWCALEWLRVYWWVPTIAVVLALGAYAFYRFWANRKTGATS
jgi:hypothetical protein